MNAKYKYDHIKSRFLEIERELISFLKNASGEDIECVVDMLKAVYDPTDELSILAAAYAIELEVMKNQKLPDKHERQYFLEEHSDLLYEAVTSEDYNGLINSGALPNDNVRLILEKFEETRFSFANKYKTSYIPSSIELSDILNRMSELSSDLFKVNFEYNGKISHYKNDAEDSVIYFFMSVVCFAYSGVGYWLLCNDFQIYREHHDTLLAYMIMCVSVIFTIVLAILYVLVPMRFIHAKRINDLDWTLESIFSHRNKLLITDLFLSILAIILIYS